MNTKATNPGEVQTPAANGNVGDIAAVMDAVRQAATGEVAAPTSASAATTATPVYSATAQFAAAHGPTGPAPTTVRSAQEAVSNFASQGFASTPSEAPALVPTQTPTQTPSEVRPPVKAPSKASGLAQVNQGFITLGTPREAMQEMAQALRFSQFDTAREVARQYLSQATPHTPWRAMLETMAVSQHVPMMTPEEGRVYLVRSEDGQAQGMVRLRDNGSVTCTHPLDGAQQWRMVNNQIVLSSEHGAPLLRFAHCAVLPVPTESPVAPSSASDNATTAANAATQQASRVYLGESLLHRMPRMLQEVSCTYSRLSMLDAELLAPFCGLTEPDALVKADWPQRTVLLLGSAHSGMHALGQWLTATGTAHIDDELLHPEGMRVASGPLGGHQTATLTAMRNIDPAWFTRVMLGRAHDADGRNLNSYAARGFLLQPGHEANTLRTLLDEQDVQMIYVARQHALAEYADLCADLLRQQPHLQRPDGLLHFDRERFERWVDLRERQYLGLRDTLTQRQADTVEVDGSRLNPATLRDLSGFISDQPSQDLPLPEAGLNSGKPVVSRFANPMVVMQCLQAMDKPEWMEPEGL